MMDEFDIEYQYAGENLAKNTSATKAHTALMNSSGHRKNILNPNFTHVGVGAKKAEQGYTYVRCLWCSPIIPYHVIKNSPDFYISREFLLS